MKSQFNLKTFGISVATAYALSLLGSAIAPAFAGEATLTRTGRNGRQVTVDRSLESGAFNRAITGSEGYERNTNTTWGEGEFERTTADSWGRSTTIRRSR